MAMVNSGLKRLINSLRSHYPPVLVYPQLGQYASLNHKIYFEVDPIPVNVPRAAHARYLIVRPHCLFEGTGMIASSIPFAPSGDGHRDLLCLSHALQQGTETLVQVQKSSKGSCSFRKL